MRDRTRTPAQGPALAPQGAAKRRPEPLSARPRTRRRGGSPALRQRPARCRARPGDEPVSGPPMQSTRRRGVVPAPTPRARRQPSPSSSAGRQSARGAHLPARQDPRKRVSSAVRAVSQQDRRQRVLPIARRRDARCTARTRRQRPSAAARASARTVPAAWHHDGLARRPRARARQSVRPGAPRAVVTAPGERPRTNARPAARGDGWHMRCTGELECGHRRVPR